MTTASILVIEDEPAIQELVAYTCSTQGYTVRRADSVGAGRDAIDRELPDMVLLDWMLPDRPGIELLKDLRAHERTKVMPVIMLTAKGNEADKVVGLDTGADDYVVKPFSPRELLSRMRAVFRRRAPEHMKEAELRRPPGAVPFPVAVLHGGEAKERLPGPDRDHPDSARPPPQDALVRLEALEHALFGLGRVVIRRLQVKVQRVVGRASHELAPSIAPARSHVNGSRPVAPPVTAT